MESARRTISSLENDFAESMTTALPRILKASKDEYLCSVRKRLGISIGRLTETMPPAIRVGWRAGGLLLLLLLLAPNHDAFRVCVLAAIAELDHFVAIPTPVVSEAQRRLAGVDSVQTHTDR